MDIKTLMPMTIMSTKVSKLQWARWKTAGAIVWENIWPAMMPLLAVVATFLILSWLGIWPLVYNGVRIIILMALVGAGVWSLWNLRHIKMPSTRQVNQRLERTSQLLHQPIETIKDNIAVKGDVDSEILWREHQRRMKIAIEELKVGVPKPNMSDVDPWAIRSVVVMMLFVAFMAKNDNGIENIKDAFRYHHGIENSLIAGRIDAWVKQPLYTNKPAIFLKDTKDANAEDDNAVDAEKQIVEIAQESELIFQTSKFENPRLVIVNNENGENEILQQNDEGNDELTQFKTKLTKDGIIKFYNSKPEDGILALHEWEYKIIKDEKPIIKFDKEPEINRQGWLEISYSLYDDYGFKNAEAIVELAHIETSQRPLFGKHTFSIPIPNNNKSENNKTSEDYTNHVFAGTEIKITLSVTDFADQNAVSESKIIKLPEKIFNEPLAQSVIFERQQLALDANKKNKIVEMLDTITTTRPDLFVPDVSHYLALRAATHRIERANVDPELLSAIELLLHTALTIENGDLSLAEQKLREIQNRLAQALENGETDEVIEELMQELRQAMQEFMKEAQKYANTQNRQNQQSLPNQNSNTQTLTQNDIDEMMKQIEDLARSGSHEAARELLRQFQQMMSNLQFNKPNNGQRDPFSEQMDELGEMMQRQQELMDQTHELQQSGRGATGNKNRMGNSKGSKVKGSKDRMGKGKGNKDRMGKDRMGKRGRLRNLPMHSNN